MSVGWPTLSGVNRTDRLYAIVEDLRAISPRCRSARELALRFEVSSRTIERDISALQQLPAYRTAIRAAIDRVNQDLSVTEKIRQFAFADEPFGIDNAMMTPSMKIRRGPIRERYGERLAALYRD